MHARDIPEPTPKSAARLAAEALFDNRPPLPAAPDGAGPLVTVLNRRRVQTPAEGHAADDAEPGAPARKTPRVFVLRPAPAAAPSDAEPQPGVSSVPVRRRRTRAAPVTVIYSAPPGPTAEQRAAAAAEAELPSSTRLAKALAAVDPILADIRAALSFDIRPQTQAAEWDRLSAQAERIAQDLAVWARQPFTPPPDKARAA